MSNTEPTLPERWIAEVSVTVQIETGLDPLDADNAVAIKRHALRILDAHGAEPHECQVVGHWPVGYFEGMTA